jgi:hypothetical protein
MGLMDKDLIFTCLALILLAVAVILVATNPRTPRRSAQHVGPYSTHQRQFNLGALIGAVPTVLIWIASFNSSLLEGRMRLFVLAIVIWIGDLVLALLFFLIHRRPIGNSLLTLFMLTPVLGALGIVMMLLLHR